MRFLKVLEVNAEVLFQLFVYMRKYFYIFLALKSGPEDSVLMYVYMQKVSIWMLFHSRQSVNWMAAYRTILNQFVVDVICLFVK